MTFGQRVRAVHAATVGKIMTLSFIASDLISDEEMLEAERMLILTRDVFDAAHHRDIDQVAKADTALTKFVEEFESRG